MSFFTKTALKRFLFFITLLGLIGSAPHAIGQSTNSKPSPEDTIAVNLLIETAQERSKTNQPDSAEYYFKKAGKLAIETRFTEGQFHYLSKYANFLYGQLRFQDALNTSQKQLTLALKMQDGKRTSNAYNNIALQYHSLGNLRSAAEYLIKALKTSENNKNARDQQKYNTNLASIFVDLKDKKNSLYYAKKGYELALTLKDSMQVARSLVNLSASEALNEQFDKAIEHTRQIAIIARQYKNVHMEIHAYINLGDMENQQLNYGSALGFYKKAEKLLIAAPDQDYDMYINYGLANSLKNLKNYKQANSYFIKVGRLAEKLMPKNDLKEVYLLGSEINEHLKQPESALKFWKKYSMLNDSLLSASTQNYIHESEIKYQTSLKEKAITQQKLQLTNNQFELQKKNRWILISAIAILLLISSCVIIYLVYRNKNQSVELSLLKAQIHPHFLFNTLNNLYALTIHKSDESPGVVLGLAEILRYILYECNTSSIGLQKEMNIVERYISLEKIRYKNRLEINLNVGQDHEDYVIAPLLILPLVENAFKHGISKLLHEGWINIESKIQDNCYTFKISNNKSVSKRPSGEPVKYGNIGLLNIKKRLKILYPGKHSIRIIDEDDVFIVIMKLQLLN